MAAIRRQIGTATDELSRFLLIIDPFFKTTEREIDMTDFDDIRKAFSAYQDAQVTYWEDLQNKTDLLVSGLEAYLGLSGQTYTDFLRGQMDAVPYIRLGRIDNGQFVPCKANGLDCVDLAVHFKMSITLERGADVYPKSNLLLSGDICRYDGHYRVRLDTLDGDRSIEIDEQFSEDSQKAMYETIARLILDKLDTEIFTTGRSALSPSVDA